jgi:uncharacterized membrane protein
VGIAFLTGTVVQFFSRLLFTFEDTRHKALVTISWSALALTVISYFLFIKGLKGAGFVTPEFYALVMDNTALFVGSLLVIWLAVSLLLRRLGINPLAFVVLAGTFALAMAFASNDLVNFIGVPLAGLESWKAWAGSGIAPDQFSMEVLRQPVQSSHLYLLGAGIIMATTLWLSAKARSVTKTEVTLARQAEGAERFSPGPFSRGFVALFVTLGKALLAITPARWQSAIDRRFQRPGTQEGEQDKPAFDLVRASVNLAVASILIAIATAMKLPLSTTFVSFMVAMGSSLADRAWGRESAAYRVAGVLTVLGGWFATAFVAFAMAGLFAIMLSLFDVVALIGLLFTVAFVLYRSFIYHGARQAREAASPKSPGVSGAA